MSANAPANQAPATIPRQPGRVTRYLSARFNSWGKWTIGMLFAGFAIICLLLYLGVQWVTYTSLVWGNGANNAVTLIRDIGHGGTSQVTVAFSDHTLLVTEMDANDPGRVTVMKVNEVILLPDESTVVTATLEEILKSGRLDLVIRLKGGLAYHTEFTTVLINNVAAVKQDPQAPGFRAPTAAELKQALQKLGS